MRRKRSGCFAARPEYKPNHQHEANVTTLIGNPPSAEALSPHLHISGYGVCRDLYNAHRMRTGIIREDLAQWLIFNQRRVPGPTLATHRRHVGSLTPLHVLPA